MATTVENPDDPIQLEEHDEEMCANQMSLSQAREAYKKGGEGYINFCKFKMAMQIAWSFFTH